MARVFYKPEFCAEAQRLCDDGATDKDLAAHFKVTSRTILRWRAAHSDFAAVIKIGKEKADARVERCLYQLATGYQIKATKIFCSKDGAVTKVPYIEEVAPDTTACIFWLKNRKPAEWRDLKAIEHSGKLTHTHVAELTDEQLARIAAGGSAGATEETQSAASAPGVH